jgi:hypothetical protein|tara:strand:+ start:301 stop:483 length:183 start_codon:yes stop_codon:yes gene_type:complete
MLKEKIIDETIDTIIDSIDEKLVDYMYEYGKYTESNDVFFNDKEEMFVEVVKILNKRVNG